MTELTVRPARPADADSLERLAFRLTTFPLPAWRPPADVALADTRAMLAAIDAGDDDNQVFVAERDGRIAGCLHIYVTTDFFGLRHGHVSVLATTEAAEGTGVARALITHAEQWSADRRLPLLTLNTFAHNARARRFYDIAGFEVEMVKYVKLVKSQPPSSNYQGTPKGQGTPNAE